MTKLNRDDWQMAVMNNRTIQGETRAVLLYLYCRMGADMKVSVPQTELAHLFGVSVCTIRNRLANARNAGLLVTVLPGKPGRTAVHQGTFPDPLVRDVPHNEQQEHVLEGVHKHSGDGQEHVLEGVHKQTPVYVRHVVAPIVSGSAPETGRCESPTGDVKQVPRPLPAATAQIDTNDHMADACVGRVTEMADARVGRETRKHLLDAIQASAVAGPYIADDLSYLLDEYEPGLGDWAVIYWTLPETAGTDRYVAGTELNKMINTYRSAA